MTANETWRSPDGYKSGNYHPVYAGEVYNDHYRVYRKLGYGGYSTVWLVKDIATNRYFAMKVLTRDAYGGQKDVFELEILQHLHKADPTHPGYKHVIQLHDHFWHDGPRGRYMCLVFPVMGECLWTMQRKMEGRIPATILKLITKQLLLALDYAHSNGIIHTDILPQNIMITLKDETVIDDFYLPGTEWTVGAQAHIPAPELPDTELDFLNWPNSDSSPPKEAETPTKLDFLHWPNSDKVPPWEVECKSLSGLHLGRNPTAADVFKIQVVVCDWGVASWTHKHLTEVVVPIRLRAPELLIEAPWGPKVDIWALGCIIYQLLAGHSAFIGEGPNEEGESEYFVFFHLIEMVALCGAFPRSLLEKGDQELVEECFDEYGFLVGEQYGKEIKWGWNLESSTGDDTKDLGRMLRGVFVVDPEERKSAKELLEARWLEDAEQITEEVKEEEGPKIGHRAKAVAEGDFGYKLLCSCALWVVIGVVFSLYMK